MGMGKHVGDEIGEWTGVAIIVVIASVVLLGFKTITYVTSGLNSTIDAFVAAFSEPANWVAIVIIALIGFAILRMYNNERKK